MCVWQLFKGHLGPQFLHVSQGLFAEHRKWFFQRQFIRRRLVGQQFKQALQQDVGLRLGAGVLQQEWKENLPNADRLLGQITAADSPPLLPSACAALNQAGQFCAKIDHHDRQQANSRGLSQEAVMGVC